MNVVFVIVCSLFFNLGYLTYHYPDSINTIIPKVSFEYPASSDEPIFNHIKMFYSGYPYSDDFKYVDYISLHNLNGSSVYVGTISIDETDTLTRDLDTVSKNILQRYDNPPEYQQIVESEVMVGKIPARQLAISVKREYINEIDWNDFGNHIYVFFQYGNEILEISYDSGYYDTPTTAPPAFFTHLLATFKIYD